MMTKMTAYRKSLITCTWADPGRIDGAPPKQKNERDKNQPFAMLDFQKILD
jgi:hypothetical protein